LLLPICGLKDNRYILTITGLVGGAARLLGESVPVYIMHYD